MGLKQLQRFQLNNLQGSIQDMNKKNILKLQKLKQTKFLKKKNKLQLMDLKHKILQIAATVTKICAYVLFKNKINLYLKFKMKNKDVPIVMNNFVIAMKI